MHAAGSALGRYWCRRLDAVHAKHVLKGMSDLPLWVVFGTVGTAMGMGIVAAIQRGTPVEFATVAALVFTIAPCMAMLLTPFILEGWMLVVTSTTAVLLFLTNPVGAGDFAPFLMVLAAGDAAVMMPWRRSLLLAVGMEAVLLARTQFDPDVTAIPLYLAAIELGWFIGFVMRIQMLQLANERQQAALAGAKAAGDERQRIAREIHDVVGHTLAVTMLHLTGARRALEQDGDVTEAVLALRNAERVGREAMADIRRTVGLLSTNETDTEVQPGIEDIPSLISKLRAAGMVVDYELRGDASHVTPAVELQLYRIAQEALANAAKHAVGTNAYLTLDVGTDEARLTVSNGRPSGVSSFSDVPNGGSGLRGMRERVTQLGGSFTAGPVGGGWQIDARVPLVNAAPGAVTAPATLRTGTVPA